MDSVSLALELPLVRLPQPYKTKYEISQSPSNSKGRIFQLRLSDNQDGGAIEPPEPLHSPGLVFSELVKSPQWHIPKESDNTAWARACRYSMSYVTWDGEIAPTVGQLWIIVYAIFSIWPAEEYFRLCLSGSHSAQLSTELTITGLSIAFPSGPNSEKTNDTVISRSAFWQGAGSPFGTRPIWIAQPPVNSSLRCSAPDFPAFPLQYTITTDFSARPIHAQHPIRPAKPARGATLYSRYIPHLDEFFSMEHLDYRNETHLRLFNKWQNDPRVAVGWNETGTLEEHREYLRKIDVDPHQMAILAKFDDNYFGYFEAYWAKEDHMGTYYPALDWDRGRHCLVGEARFRGPHRAAVWWNSLIHYLFLDEPRTTCVVGEPKAVNERVGALDASSGFHIYKWGDLPHKRSAIVRCERVRFFEIGNFANVTSIGTAKSAKPKL